MINLIPGKSASSNCWKGLICEVKTKRQSHAVDKLGGEKWFMVNRHSDNFRGHGLPDLLEAWNFALCLKKPRREYEEV